MKFAAEGTVVPFPRRKASDPTGGAPALIEIPGSKPTARRSRRKTVLLTRLNGEAGPAPAPAVKGTPRPRKTPTLAERLDRLTDKSAGPDGVWVWKGSVGQGNGRPQITYTDPYTGKYTTKTVARAVMEQHLGRKLERHEHVLHAIGVPPHDVNPRHLRIGSHTENMADAAAEGRLRTRLDVATVLKIVELRRKHRVDTSSIATRFGLCNRTVNDILRGATHSKVTGIKLVPGNKGGRPALAVPPTLQAGLTQSPEAVHLTA